MKRIGERLTFLAMLVMILVGLCSCNADLNRLLFGYVAEVRDSSGIHEFDSIQEGIDYIVQRNGASRDVGSSSKAIEGLEEKDIVYLVRDVGEGEYGEFFKGKSITVNNYNGVIGIDFQDHVYRFENDTEGGMFFNILDGSEVHIRGGHTIILASNPSPEYAMIVQSPNVKLTDHWLEDRRVHSKLMDEDRVTEWNLTKGVYVGANGKLVIDGEKTELGSVIEVKTGGEFEINNCKLTKIYALTEEGGEGTANVTIKGGTIEHPHKLGPRISSAASGHEDSVRHEFIHVPSDFIYAAASDGVTRSDIDGGATLYSKVVCWCDQTDVCKVVTKGYVSMNEISGYDDYLVWRNGDTKKEPFKLGFENWNGSPKTDRDIIYRYNTAPTEATKAVGYLVFRNNLTGSATYCGREFEIKAGNGYGGIDVNLPDDVDIGDMTKPTGKLSFNGQGVVSFAHEGTGSAATQYQWNIDNGKYFYPSPGAYADCSSPDSVNSVDLVALEDAGAAGIDPGISHKVVLHVKNKAGQTTLSMNVYMPEGELVPTIFRIKTVNDKVKTDIQNVVFEPVIHSDDADNNTAQIYSRKWTVDGIEMPPDDLNANKLNLPSLSVETDGSGHYTKAITDYPDLNLDGVESGKYLDAEKFKVGNTDLHKVELTLTYWGGRRSCTYRLCTQDDLGNSVEGYKVRNFTDR